MAKGRILAFSIDLLRSPLKHSRTTVRVCGVMLTILMPLFSYLAISPAIAS